MLVIHGLWAEDALQLWAEDTARLAGPRPRRGRPPRLPGPHPFAASPDDLTAVLGDLADVPAAFAPAAARLPDLARAGAGTELALQLPSERGGPMPSPAALRDPAGPVPHGPPWAPEPETADRGRPGPGASALLAAWRVPALAFPPAVALDLLAALAGPGARSPRAVCGGSVPYLAAVARLAADLAARCRVLPAFDAGEDGGYTARWRPVLAGADAQRARELAAAMPPLCRAAGREPPAAGELLAGALDALADAAARHRLGHEPGSGLLPGRRGRSARLTVTERWLAALTGADPAVPVSAPEQAEAARLAAALDAWHGAAQLPLGPVRACFRLVEPAAAGSETAAAEPAAQWRVEFALQSTEDPSLILAAADIWSGAAAPGAAAGSIAHPQEELLAGLGAAARLFPQLDLALREAAPAAVSLDTEGALGFLRETAPLLSGAGFGVLLPDWVRKSRIGLKITTRTASVPGGGPARARFGLADLVDFRCDLAVGEQVLEPAELAELARLKVPLLRLRGQWVELDEEHLQAALRFVERSRTGTMTGGDALLAGLRQEHEDLPVLQVDAEGWVGDLLSGHAERRLAPVAAPVSFRGELRPYQERGVAWLAFLDSLGLGGILADSMGLGKTVQLLALLAHERETAPPGARPAPTLLVCPMSLAGNWQQEASRFTPRLRVHVHHGADRLTGGDLASELAAADLVVTTYGLVVRDGDALSRLRWARVVCDEAQNIKNAASRQARAVRGLPASSRIALTGTPVENRLADLWSIMEFTSPGLLGPAEQFRARYAVPIERDGDPEAALRLKRMTGPFILRRLKTDPAIISDLPDKLEMKIWCSLTPEQASLYQATVTDMLARIEAAPEGIERRGLVLATMARLKQACNHPAHLLGDGSRLEGRSGKLSRLEEICDEAVAEGDKVLCFTQYATFGRMLQPYLAARLGCPVLYLHGGTPKKQRDALVAWFQETAGPAVFLLSLKAGGTGLNLTAASHVIHVDRWWNPAVEDQATDRAFRIGQRKDVQVRTFVCVGTLEERIDSMIEEKKALAERIVGTGEGWLTELSVAQLREVIALSPAAVTE